MSTFSTLKNRGEDEDSPMPDIDESKMEQAMNVLAREAEGLDENDPGAEIVVEGDRFRVEHGKRQAEHDQDDEQNETEQTKHVRP